MTGLIIAIVILVALGIFVVMIYNGLVSGRNAVKNAWRQIDVQLKRRHDLIPNLVSVVKDSMKHDRETLTQVIEARNKAVSANAAADNGGDLSAAVGAEAALSGAVGKLFAVMEAYPDLKSQGNIANLMEELTGTENKISFARQHYNDSVMTQNNKVESFPGNLVAGMFGFKTEALYEIPEADRAEMEKAPPSVSLS